MEIGPLGDQFLQQVFRFAALSSDCLHCKWCERPSAAVAESLALTHLQDLQLDLQVQVRTQACEFVAHFVMAGVDAQFAATQHVVPEGVHCHATAWTKPDFERVKRQSHAHSDEEGPRTRCETGRSIFCAHERRNVSCAVRCVESLQGAEAI